MKGDSGNIGINRSVVSRGADMHGHCLRAQHLRCRPKIIVRAVLYKENCDLGTKAGNFFPPLSGLPLPAKSYVLSDRPGADSREPADDRLERWGAEGVYDPVATGGLPLCDLSGEADGAAARSAGAAGHQECADAAADDCGDGTDGQLCVRDPVQRWT